MPPARAPSRSRCSKRCSGASSDGRLARWSQERDPMLLLVMMMMMMLETGGRCRPGACARLMAAQTSKISLTDLLPVLAWRKRQCITTPRLKLAWLLADANQRPSPGGRGCATRWTTRAHPSRKAETPNTCVKKPSYKWPTGRAFPRKASTRSSLVQSLAETAVPLNQNALYNNLLLGLTEHPPSHRYLWYVALRAGGASVIHVPSELACDELGAKQATGVLPDGSPRPGL